MTGDWLIQIHSLQYRIQHESIPLSEEKQLLREIKQLEGTREKVMANAAMRAKIQDSLGQKEAIQDQVKVREFGNLLYVLKLISYCTRVHFYKYALIFLLYLSHCSLWELI